VSSMVVVVVLPQIWGSAGLRGVETGKIDRVAGRRGIGEKGPAGRGVGKTLPAGQVWHVVGLLGAGRPSSRSKGGTGGGGAISRHRQSDDYRNVCCLGPV
jgi:hypothetical protein